MVKNQWSRQPVIFRSRLPCLSLELRRSASKTNIFRVKDPSNPFNPWDISSGRVALAITGVPFLPAHAWKSTMRFADAIYRRPPSGSPVIGGKKFTANENPCGRQSIRRRAHVTEKQPPSSASSCASPCRFRQHLRLFAVKNTVVAPASDL